MPWLREIGSVLHEQADNIEVLVLEPCSRRASFGIDSPGFRFSTEDRHGGTVCSLGARPATPEAPSPSRASRRINRTDFDLSKDTPTALRTSVRADRSTHKTLSKPAGKPTPPAMVLKIAELLDWTHTPVRIADIRSPSCCSRASSRSSSCCLRCSSLPASLLPSWLFLASGVRTGSSTGDGSVEPRTEPLRQVAELLH